MNSVYHPSYWLERMTQTICFYQYKPSLLNCKCCTMAVEWVQLVGTPLACVVLVVGLSY